MTTSQFSLLLVQSSVPTNGKISCHKYNNLLWFLIGLLYNISTVSKESVRILKLFFPFLYEEHNTLYKI